MPLSLVLLIYNLLLPAALLVLLPASVLKMRKRGGYGSKFWERFGRFDGKVQEKLEAVSGRCRWIHAVSVGEVNVARKLIDELLAVEPWVPVVLSVTTSTGYAVAGNQAPDGLVVIYSPVDLPWVAGRVFKKINPRQFILVEAEVWPNLVRQAKRERVPVILVNARLSPRSERRFRRFRVLAAPVFGMLDRILVQEQEDVGRWEGIGGRQGAVQVTGSIKFDQQGQAAFSAGKVEEFRNLLTKTFGGLRPRVVLLASSHAGEEQAVAAVWGGMRGEFPGVRLVLVPRHAERRDEVLAEVQAAGLKAVLRSKSGQDSSLGEDVPDVLVVDSTGELRDWQALAEVVIVGKSFLARGGQNPVEAIAAGVPVLTGPHMENFAALMKLLQVSAGILQVADVEELGPALRKLLLTPNESKAMARRGKAALEKHAGATRRTAAALWLGPQDGH